VQDEIRHGHVIAPFGFVPGPHALSLWVAPHLRLRADVRRLSSWIESEMLTLGADNGMPERTLAVEPPPSSLPFKESAAPRPSGGFAV
jgi:hypothetical protein